MINYDEFYKAKFISPKEYSGFKTNHEYTLKINENKPYGIIITVFGDEDFEQICPYSNLPSLERVWKIES